MNSQIKNLRKYGNPPYTAAVIHGGPGAPGQVAPVARELSACTGVLEPFQTEKSFTGQVNELYSVLDKNADLPVTLIGFSWGAWLAYMAAARHPATVKKLILVSSGSFEEHYAGLIYQIRISRLDEEERKQVLTLLRILEDPLAEDKNSAFERLGKLFTKADAYDPFTEESETIAPRYDIFESVWEEAVFWRSSGKLLKSGKNISCPVVAIHGDHDPHPAEGVREPLTRILKSFRFILLKNCGHVPWIERYARDTFFRILKEELATGEEG